MDFRHGTGVVMRKHNFLWLSAILLPAALWAGDGSFPPAERMAALAVDPHLILLKAAVFDPLQSVPPESRFSLTDSREKKDGNLIHIVQFRHSPDETDRTLLARLHAEIFSYIPNRAYLVRLTPDAVAALAGSPEVRAVFRLPKFAKVDPRLFRNPEAAMDVEIMTIREEDGPRIAERLRTRFPAVPLLSRDRHHRQGRILCSLSPESRLSVLDAVSGWEAVLSILPWMLPEVRNDHSIWVGQSYDTVNKTDYAASATIWNHGITGTGQIVCVNDTGLDSDMCYFRYSVALSSKTIYQVAVPPSTGAVNMSMKVIAYYLEPGAEAYDTNYYGYHGTHTSGTVAGDNYATLSTPSSGGHDTGDGMAPSAKLIMQDVGDSQARLTGLMGDLTPMFQQAYDAGARIHNDSWGSNSNIYDAIPMTIDAFTYRHEDFLFVVSAGNAGPAAGSLGTPATAKNACAVGATSHGSDTDARDLLGLSARGPVFDGRLKPDLTAPGDAVNSARGDLSNSSDNCSSWGLTGTSMAAPTVTGLAALARQYFTDGFYPSGSKTAEDARIPSAALLKACLLAGASPLDGTDRGTTLPVSPIPSPDQGWGRIHLENVLFFGGDGRRARVWDIRNSDGLSTGQQAEYTVSVPSNSQPLKVHLVWTDPESTPLAAVNLVNNLDLEVVAPGGGTTYKGNVFSSGQSTPGGTADNLNPVEGFVLDSPVAGDWTLRVKAASVPGAATVPYSNRQGYALVTTYAACVSSLPAPAGLTAADNGTTGINLTWNTVSGAAGYVVYKAVGADPAPGDYSVLLQQAGTAFSDTKVQGGYTYWYKVRATDNCSESPLSPAATAAYSGNCTFYPAFGGLSNVANAPGTQQCDLILSWAHALSLCPLGPGIRYNIYRGGNPYFAANASSLVAHGVEGTAYTDSALTSHQTYYYIVRAEDGTTLNGGPHNGGNEDPNTLRRKGTPWAPSSSPGTFLDDGGDGNAKLELAGAWRITNLENHTAGGHFSYASSDDGYPYPGGACSAVTTPPLLLQAGVPTLNYWARYNIEYGWDGVVVEISANGGGSWSPGSPIGGYPSSFFQTGHPPVNACGYNASQGAFSGPAGNGGLTDWTLFSHDLSAFSGQTVLIRWRLSSDGGTEYPGFYLDDISITLASVNDACSPPNPKEASPAGSPMTAFKADGGAVQIDFAPGCGATGHSVYWGWGPIAGTIRWSDSVCDIAPDDVFDPGDNGPGQWCYFAVVAQNGSAEGSYGRDSSGIERPEAENVGLCDLPMTLTGVCP